MNSSMNKFKYKEKKNDIVSILICSIPILIYFYFLSVYAVNIPKWDDHALKSFLLNFHLKKDFFSKVLTLFKQHNEHRIAFDRLITLIVVWIHGSIEYRWLMWVGNFTLIGITGIFFKIFYENKLPLRLFIPIPFLIFQLELWENTFWGMASLQNFGILLFALSLLYCVTSSIKRSHFYLSFLFAFFATFTSGNGLLVHPICILLLILQSRWKDALLYGLVALILIILYFYDYQTPPNNPALPEVNIKKIILSFLCFNGSILDLLITSAGRVKLTALGGFLLVVLALLFITHWLLKSKVFTKTKSITSNEYFLLGCLIFLAGTAMIVTFVRFDMGETGLLTSRYKIYSILLVVVLYSGLMLKGNLNLMLWLNYPIMLITLIFNFVANFNNFDDMINLRRQLITMSANWDLESSGVKHELPITLYETPNTLFHDAKNQLLKPIKQLPKWKEKLTYQSENNDQLFIQNISFKPLNLNNIDDGAYLIAQSDTHTIIFPTIQQTTSIKSYLRSGKYWAKGFTTTINKPEFQNGKYYLGIWIQDGNQSYQFYLNDSLRINNSNVNKVEINW